MREVDYWIAMSEEVGRERLIFTKTWPIRQRILCLLAIRHPERVAVFLCEDLQAFQQC